MDPNKTEKPARLSMEKVKGFSIGAQPKSRFQKQKEEVEARKRKEEEEAAKVFEDFVASFEGEGGDSKGSKGKPTKTGAFVRGDSVNSGLKSEIQPAGEVYRMIPKAQQSMNHVESKPIPHAPIIKTPEPQLSSGESLASRMQSEADKKEKKQPKRSIDALMEEFKSQPGGGSSKARKTDRGSDAGTYRGTIEDAASGVRGGGEAQSEDGDPETTNLYVGNLHPQVSEEVLMREFGPFGPIASVKIMWPRSEEEKRRSRNCGFVNMMYRADAERAKDAMSAKELVGLELRIGWGKALPKPAVPCYIHRDSQNALLQPGGGGLSSEVTVHLPSDRDLRRLIDKMAEYVAREGHEFERAVIHREMDNPDFDFLWEPQSREGIYYKWRVYAYCQSDTAAEWRRSAFKMFAGGITWLPPVDDAERDRRSRSPSPRDRSRKGGGGGGGSRRRGDQLTDGERDSFEDMLRTLTAERESVGDAMVFALGRAEAAKEIVEVVTESLCILQTPIPAKVARLYLVSDILHNSSAAVAKASLFRGLFEASMPAVFASFGEKLRATEGRITAQAMRDKVCRVLRVWEVWSLYPQDFIARLEAVFLGIAPPADLAGGVGDNGVGGEKASWGGGGYDDVDGVPLDGIDGAPLDAVQEADEDDFDGEPLEEDDFNPNLPVSKWNQPKAP